MDSRSSPEDIWIISEQLKTFTLRELVFILQFNEQLSKLDSNKFRRITDSLRFRFGGQQSLEQVTTAIHLLGDIYSQTLPIQQKNSLVSLSHQRWMQSVITPFSLVCSTCSLSLNISHASQRQIKLYQLGGTVSMGSIMFLICNHHGSAQHSMKDCTIMYPNFVLQNQQHVYNHTSLHHGNFIYMGGDVAIERKMMEKFSAELIHHGASIHCSMQSLNQEAFNQGHGQISPVDSHVLSNLFYRYLFIQMNLCMGKASVSTPSKMEEYDLWAWKQFPQILSCFVYLWMNHAEMIGLCDEQCSKCIVVDGHQKARRRICAHKNINVGTAELVNVTVGCCRTPTLGSRFCDLHQHCEKVHLDEANVKRKASVKRKKLIRKNHRRIKRCQNSLNATNCRTRKDHNEEYIQKCARSFGLIALVFNCKIVCGFSELFRSETLKEIVHLFCSCIRASGRLAPTLVYDDGCHLVAHVRKRIGKDLMQTDALQLFANTPVSVDRMHFKNHVGRFCRSEMNPNNNPLLNNVNTQSAEQCFSWLRRYAAIISSMNWLRTPIYMVILFHLKNLSHVNRRPSDIFAVYDVAPKVLDISLAHISDNPVNLVRVDQHKDSIVPAANKIFKPIDLPDSATDWKSIISQIRIRAAP